MTDFFDNNDRIEKDMWDALQNDDTDTEGVICSACKGSGEGRADGTICWKCKGAGEVEE